MNKAKIFLIIVLLTFVSLTSVMAWYVYDKNKEIMITPGTFQVDIDTRIVNEAKGINLSKAQTIEQFYDKEKSVLTLDGGNPDTTNSISNLKVDLIINAKIKGYFRIKIKDEWKVIRTYKQNNLVKEDVISFIDDRFTNFTILNDKNFKVDKESNFIYYIVPVNKGVSTISFIDGGLSYILKNNEIYSEECLINLDFDLEIVQANRYKEKFGITSFSDLSNLL